MARETAAGGPGTIGGIVYQILWCLLRSLRVHLEPGKLAPPNSESTLLILEPSGGGGDLQVQGAVIEIEQLKARADGGTWSLQSIISDVLPDLFLAATNQKGRNCVYRFVTEGRMGGWKTVYDSFQKLDAIAPETAVVDRLDNESILRFQTSRRSKDDGELFFPLEAYTQKTLFLRIAEQLLTRPAIRNLNLTKQDLHHVLWDMLSRFEFVGGQTLEATQREIDVLLLAVVDHREDIPAKRDEMAMLLLNLASEGHSTIDPAEFLTRCGLSATPLTQWGELRNRAQLALRKAQSWRRFDRNLDVRSSLASSSYEVWKSSKTSLIVTGESGSGKTWTLDAVADLASCDDAPIVWVEATGDTEKDLQSAADRFWLEIRGGADRVPRLQQVVQRLAEVVPSASPHKLRIFVDNVPTFGEALGLLRGDWETQGVQIAFSCSPIVADSLQRDHQERVLITVCGDLTWEEVNDYLDRRTGVEWVHIPEDVRDTLRRPLLARIYADELFAGEWKPTNEYELYQRVWRRLSTGTQAAFPLDAAQIEVLGGQVLLGGPYPWTLQQCVNTGLTQDALQRLEQCGWLIRTQDERVRVFHDRLLNWAVAQSLYADLRGNRISATLLAERLAEIYRNGGLCGNAFLGYVPLDTLWLITSDPQLNERVAPEILEVLERNGGWRPEFLYQNLITTLGTQAVTAIYERLKRFNGYPWVLEAMLDAMAAVGKDRIHGIAAELLDSDDKQLQRRGLKLLCRVSCPELLDRIWRLHCDGAQNPQPFLFPGEDSSRLREDSFGALSRASKEQHRWIAQTIDAADPAYDPVQDLGWLVYEQRDRGGLWRQCKKTLLEKLPDDALRVRAHNIGKFRDSEELDWLLKQIAGKTDRVGSSALRALSRTSPDKISEGLTRIDEFELYMSRNWSLAEVFSRSPAATLEALQRRMKQSSDPWQLARAMCDLPNCLHIGVLNLLLDTLTTRLNLLVDELTAIEKDSGDSNGRFRLVDRHHHELRILAGIHDPDLLDCVRARRGSEFENALVLLLGILGAKRGISQDCLSRGSVFVVLRNIGGASGTHVLNQLLPSESKYGRLEVRKWACRQPDQETFQLLKADYEREETWDGKFPLEQGEALIGLACHEQWEAVAEGLSRWGMECTDEITRLRIVPRDFNAPWMDKYREAVTETATHGDILVLGFAGVSSDTNLIHEVLARATTPPKTKHACIIALHLLRDNSDRGVELVSGQLDNPSHRYSAVRMLGWAGTPRAWDALHDALKKEFDHVLALNLINLSSHAEDVLEQTKKSLMTSNSFNEVGHRSILIRGIRNPENKARLLSHQWLRDRLRQEAVANEGNIWTVGTKAASIECLGEFDSRGAFAAALRAIENTSGHDRQLYAEIMVKLDQHRAIEFLLQRLRVETCGLVRYSICRSLMHCDIQRELHTLLHSNDAIERELACQVIGHADCGSEFLLGLQDALEDFDEAVITSAVEALSRLKTREICDSLREHAIRAQTINERWLYLDHLFEMVEPGLHHEDFPKVVCNIREDLSPLIANQLSKRLNDRREKLAKDLKEK